MVDVSPEVNEKVRNLACRWQQALQVDRVVAGETKASSRDDGCTELQAFVRTDGEKRSGKREGEIENDDMYMVEKNNKGDSNVKR